MGIAASERPATALLIGPSDPDLQSSFPGEVDRAESASQALARLAAKQYDIVFVNQTTADDVDEEQLSSLRAARAVRPDARFIVVSARSTAQQIINAMRDGTFAYFTRPVQPAALREAIALALSFPDREGGVEVLSAAPDFISLRLRCSLEAVDRVALFMRELPSELAENERRGLVTALRETLLNAIEHGGRLDPDQWVRVSRIRTKRALAYHIQDPGEGFSRHHLKHAAIANPLEDPTAHIEVRTSQNMRPGGFGMLITSELVDEVIYNQKGNEVILVKHLDQSAR